ncbi:hypothetical protein CRENBAI_018197 [Crenichthys baileyi]|uniref:Uncharacterized protein n=1 Tax=Crenichthys baileyi TaxID=28760 RepID=A0AAV9SPZ5_9TELE
MEEGMRHLLADLEVLPSPLLLEQMEREPVQHRSPSAPLVAHPDPAAKPMSSSRHKKRRLGAPSRCSAGEEVGPMPADMKAAPLPKPSSHSPVQDFVVTPDELEECLSFFAHQIKSFRRASLLYPSPELIEKIRQMEEDYRTAVRQFYCRPPPSFPGLQSAAAEQPTPRLQSAAAEKPTPRLQGAAAAAQPLPGLQSAAAAGQLMPCLQNKAAALPTSCLQMPAIVQPKSPSTSSTQRRGRRIRDASTQVIGGPGDASAQVIGGPGDASAQVIGGPGDASAQVIGGPADASAPAQATEGSRRRLSSHATEGLGDTSAPAHTTEGLGDASASAPGLKVFQGFTERLVLVLISETQDEGFEEEPPPDPVSEGFKERLVLVLASEGPPDAASASQGPVSSVPVSEGSPDTVKVKPDSKPPEFHQVPGRSSTLLGRPPDRGSSNLLG